MRALTRADRFRRALAGTACALLAVWPHTGVALPDPAPRLKPVATLERPADAVVQTRTGPAESGTDYSVMIRGESAGSLAIRRFAGSWTEAEMQFSDNGRGPTIRERWRSDADGRAVEYRAEGSSTYGAAIDEHFAIGPDQRLQWHSRIDRGDQVAPAAVLFIPLDPSPAFIGRIAADLLARPNRRAPLLGGGEASVEVLQSVAVATAKGSRTLMLVAVTGIDSDPGLVWLEGRPGHPLFALLDTRIQVIAKGEETLTAELLALQSQAEDARLEGLHRRLSIGLPGVTLIRNVRWFDAHSARLEGPADIWLDDGRIASITQTGTARILPNHLIDGSGQTLLPGLVDAHVHYSDDQGLSRLAAGVTMVRDMGGSNQRVRSIRARIERGEIAGPTVIAAGFLEGRSRFSSRNGFVVDSADEARNAIDWYARNGYHTIKLYSSIRPEWVSTIVRQAQRRGLRITGHVPSFMRAEDAVLAGFDELAHINQVLLNFVSRPGDDTRTTLRFTRVGDDAHAFHPTGREAQQFIALLKARRTVVDPTLVTFESMFTQRQGEPNPSMAEIAAHLPAQWQRELRAADFDLEGPRLQSYRLAFERMLEMTREMHQAGVTLITGTDSGHGFSLHRELALYVRAGIAPASALRSATIEAARALGEGERRGSIERGRIADLVLVSGDPTLRITDLRRTTLVIRGTVAWQPARLYQALGIRPFVEPLAVDSMASDD